MIGSSVPLPSRPTEVGRLELARFPPDASLADAIARACELSAAALHVERVGVWLFIDDRRALRCANLFERSKGVHSSGAVLQVADFPTYFASLTIRKAIPAEFAATAPWTAELASAYLLPLGITSLLDAGIFVDGVLVGVVCHEHVGPPREWTTEARDFAGSVADLLALRIQSAEVRELRAAFRTERTRLAAQEKATALELLAAGVAHDFNNLLMVFRGYGTQLSADPDVPARVRRKGQGIIAAVDRGTALAGDLLDFARPVSRPPAVHDPAALTAELLPVIQSAVGPRHPLDFSKPSNLGRILIDKSQFTRLLLNLVVNAREAMPSGGPIEIRLRAVAVTDHASLSGQFILLEVTDAGGGMDEATKRRIFEPFFTTKDKGTGLGLGIVRQVVDRAGGLIRVDSAPGRGTTVRVFFPRIGSGTGEAAVPAAPATGAGLDVT